MCTRNKTVREQGMTKEIRNGYKVLYTRKTCVRDELGIILDKPMKTKVVNFIKLL